MYVFFCYLLERKLFSAFIRFSNLINTPWKINFLIMSLKVTQELPWCSFNFNLFVILMENLFIMEATCFSPETNSLFFLSNILSEFNPLLLKYGLTVSQNLLSCVWKIFYIKILKIVFLSSPKYRDPKIPLFFIICLIYLFLILIYAYLLLLRLWTWKDCY